MESTGIKNGEMSCLAYERTQEDAKSKRPMASLKAGDLVPKKENPPPEIMPAKLIETRSRMSSGEEPSQRESSPRAAGKKRKPAPGFRLFAE